MEEQDLIGVDKLRLDEEWAHQPRAHHQLCLDAADAKLKEAEAKAEMELVEAELDHDIRLHPQKYALDGGKLTEKVVANAVRRCKRYQDALRDCLVARHGKDVCEAAVSASEHKKKGLEGLVQLHLSGWFAQPKLKGSGMTERERIDLRRRAQQKAVVDE